MCMNIIARALCTHACREAIADMAWGVGTCKISVGVRVKLFILDLHLHACMGVNIHYRNILGM